LSPGALMPGGRSGINSIDGEAAYVSPRFKPFRNLRLWMADIPVHIPRIRNKNDERFNRRPAFKLENLLHGIGVCRIAADAPYGIGGIYDRASAPEYVKALNNVGFEIQ